MLDAFGKGASDDIQAAKSELYSQVADPSRQGPPSLCPHTGTRVRLAMLFVCLENPVVQGNGQRLHRAAVCAGKGCTALALPRRLLHCLRNGNCLRCWSRPQHHLLWA